MNRIHLVAAGLLATGCYTSPTYYNEIDVFWQFSRNILGPPASTVPYSCAQAGVDFVIVTDQLGNPIGPPSLDCTQTDVTGNPVQGIAFSNFVPGASYTFVVQGFSNRFPDVPLFQGQQTITFGGGLNQVTVTAGGLSGTLTPMFTFQGTSFASCSAATVQRFDYTLRDGTGTTVVSTGSATCGAGASPAIAFGSVDLGTYFLSVAAVNTSGITATVIDSICRFEFDHFGNDSPTIDLKSGACANP